MRLSVNDRHNIISNSQLYVEDKLIEFVNEFISVYGYENYVQDYKWIHSIILKHIIYEIERYNNPFNDVVNVKSPIVGYKLN